MSEAGEEDEPTTTDGGDHMAGDETTTHGGDRMEDDGSGNPATEKKKKKERKDRKPTVLANTTDEITKVSESGLSLEPADIAAGYGMQLGCIVRDSMSINTKHLRSEANERFLVQPILLQLFHAPPSHTVMPLHTAVRHLAIRVASHDHAGISPYPAHLAETSPASYASHVHRWYTFPAKYNTMSKSKKVNRLAITKMSNALSSWRSRVKNKIEKGESWEKISRGEPILDEAEFEIFKGRVSSCMAAWLSAPALSCNHLCRRCLRRPAVLTAQTPRRRLPLPDLLLAAPKMSSSSSRKIAAANGFGRGSLTVAFTNR
ncbi:hypothetical protein QYE76_052431 [Lolium multiflorum]|uniref:Uncharacterized protein n=1 Tax=Lolium multiflorum TaxID=4521 RepID=A0AAD8SU34_LOLMU|nr:hypothetical protein QYE76_052431 [Lolium multiflorum]